MSNTEATIVGPVHIFEVPVGWNNNLLAIFINF